ncbi:MAG: GtrA family protein [Lachnospiraceae bacterium]|nr:GtrA family protein [Lachnospiraceae bacterium]
MKKLLDQIAKFGIVGIICFIIDYVLYWILCRVFTAVGFADRNPNYYLYAQAISFIVSMISNYLLSMKYVFVRRDDMSRGKEFVIFAVLSTIGLVINEICLYIGFGLIYRNWPWLNKIMSEMFAETFFKFGATAVVMVYNFISRKIFLEKKEEKA